MSGLSVPQMQLVEPALGFALALREACPSTIFLSGRRQREDQARAMAQDTARERGFVARTYYPSHAKSAIVVWLAAHPEVTGVGGFYRGILGVLQVLTDEELSHLTHHFLGLALDIAPGSCDDVFLSRLVDEYGGKLLLKEGGLIRRHVEFSSSFADQTPT